LVYLPIPLDLECQALISVIYKKYNNSGVRVQINHFLSLQQAYSVNLITCRNLLYISQPCLQFLIVILNLKTISII
jgi:hypothetical protein